MIWGDERCHGELEMSRMVGEMDCGPAPVGRLFGRMFLRLLEWSLQVFDTNRLFYEGFETSIIYIYRERERDLTLAVQ